MNSDQKQKMMSLLSQKSGKTFREEEDGALLVAEDDSFAISGGYLEDNGQYVIEAFSYPDIKILSSGRGSSLELAFTALYMNLEREQIMHLQDLELLTMKIKAMEQLQGRSTNIPKKDE